MKNKSQENLQTAKVICPYCGQEYVIQLETTKKPPEKSDKVWAVLAKCPVCGKQHRININPKEDAG